MAMRDRLAGAALADGAMADVAVVQKDFGLIPHSAAAADLGCLMHRLRCLHSVWIEFTYRLGPQHEGWQPVWSGSCQQAAATAGTQKFFRV